MEDAFLVSGMDGGGDLAGQRQKARGRQWAVLAQILVQRLAGEVFEHEIGAFARGAVSEVLIADADDARMAEPFECSRFRRISSAILGRGLHHLGF